MIDQLAPSPTIDLTTLELKKKVFGIWCPRGQSQVGELVPVDGRLQVWAVLFLQEFFCGSKKIPSTSGYNLQSSGETRGESEEWE